jgi:orotate phosphoribosyltransferase
MTEKERAIDREWCRSFIDHNCIFRSPPGEFLLISRSGFLSVWQFYLPVALLDPEFARRAGLLFWDRFSTEFKRQPFQICGCESGGILLMCALQAAAFESGVALNAFAIKKAAKSYGIGNWLEGVVHQDMPVLLVDDVIGEGKTIGEQSERLRSFGLKVMGVFAVASCKRAVPFNFGDRNIPATALFGPDAFARTHERYVRKYGRQPIFQGVMR